MLAGGQPPCTKKRGVCSVDVFPLVLLRCCRALFVSFGIFAGKLLATKFNLFLRQCKQIRLDDTLGFYASWIWQGHQGSRMTRVE